jgi:myo-inositol-1(or 4)-monophosphatase
LDLAWVAAGRADAYFEAGVHPWDIAAGALMVREAGGRICDFRGRSPGRMDVAPAGGSQLIAGALKVVEPLQQAIVATGYAKAFS